MTLEDLRRRSAHVLRRVEHGDSLTVTRDGEPVAVLAPLSRHEIEVEELIARRSSLPILDADEQQAGVDELISPELWPR